VKDSSSSVFVFELFSPSYCFFTAKGQGPLKKSLTSQDDKIRSFLFSGLWGPALSLAPHGSADGPYEFFARHFFFPLDQKFSFFFSRLSEFGTSFFLWHWSEACCGPVASSFAFSLSFP